MYPVELKSAVGSRKSSRLFFSSYSHFSLQKGILLLQNRHLSIFLSATATLRFRKGMADHVRSTLPLNRRRQTRETGADNCNESAYLWIDAPMVTHENYKLFYVGA
jgi:hypothetical protein